MRVNVRGKAGNGSTAPGSCASARHRLITSQPKIARPISVRTASGSLSIGFLNFIVEVVTAVVDRDIEVKVVLLGKVHQVGEKVT